MAVTVQTDVENDALIINGTTVHMISAAQPEDIDYTAYGINDALIIDNTGAFRDKEALSRHLVAKGASKVLLTAPGAGVPNIVHGVNHKAYNPDTIDIFSAMESFFHGSSSGLDPLNSYLSLPIFLCDSFLCI